MFQPCLSQIYFVSIITFFNSIIVWVLLVNAREKEMRELSIVHLRLHAASCSSEGQRDRLSPDGVQGAGRDI